MLGCNLNHVRYWFFGGIGKWGTYSWKGLHSWWPSAQMFRWLIQLTTTATKTHSNYSNARATRWIPRPASTSHRVALGFLGFEVMSSNCKRLVVAIRMPRFMLSLWPGTFSYVPEARFASIIIQWSWHWQVCERGLWRISWPGMQLYSGIDYWVSIPYRVSLTIVQKWSAPVPLLLSIDVDSDTGRHLTVFARAHWMPT